MTDKKAMAMALEALETLMIERESIYEKSIAALKEQLAQPEQEPVQEPVAEIVCDALGCLTTRWNDGWIPNEGDKLYSIPPQRTDQEPPQRTEQNFCPRCGKRTPDLITIHTCTPPQEGT
jgi:hypothetical protein